MIEQGAKNSPCARGVYLLVTRERETSDLTSDSENCCEDVRQDGVTIMAIRTKSGYPCKVRTGHQRLHNHVSGSLSTWEPVTAAHSSRRSCTRSRAVLPSVVASRHMALLKLWLIQIKLHFSDTPAASQVLSETSSCD